MIAKGSDHENHNDIFTTLAAALLCAAPAVHAQDYPTRAIRVIVPLTPGLGRGHRRAHRRQAPERRLQAAGAGREPPRRRRHHRHAGDAQRRGRRLHADGAVGLARRQPGHLQEPALRPAEGHRRCRDPRHHAVRDDRGEGRRVPDAEVADRRGEGAARARFRSPPRASAARRTSPPSTSRRSRASRCCTSPTRARPRRSRTPSPGAPRSTWRRSTRRSAT